MMKLSTWKPAKVAVKVEATAEVDHEAEVIPIVGHAVDHIPTLHIHVPDHEVEVEVEVTVTVDLAVDHTLTHHTHQDPGPDQDLPPYLGEEDHQAFLTDDELLGINKI